jgi:predicted ATPase
MFVSAIRVDDRDDERRGYPWSVPAIRSFARMELTRPVTFLMGENGSGKSTFLEGLAIAAKATAVGAKDLGSDATLAGAARFASALTIISKAPKRSSTRLFFRSEDAFGFTRRVEGGARELRELATELAGDAKASESARKRASGYIEGQRRALTARYGEDVHARSHGETFLEILRQRIVPRGLYFLDEPETPLSPTRVLALLLIVQEAAEAGSQFVIATHSPILAALPGATILVFEHERIVETHYEDLEHVRVTRDFLNAPERYLRHIRPSTAP